MSGVLGLSSEMNTYQIVAVLYREVVGRARGMQQGFPLSSTDQCQVHRAVRVILMQCKGLWFSRFNTIGKKWDLMLQWLTDLRQNWAKTAVVCMAVAV